METSRARAMAAETETEIGWAQEPLRVPARLSAGGWAAAPRGLGVARSSALMKARGIHRESMMEIPRGSGFRPTQAMAMRREWARARWKAGGSVSVPAMAQPMEWERGPVRGILRELGFQPARVMAMAGAME
jgi:hypothetical protein